MARPLISVGTIIDKSWHTYRTHFGMLMSISGWMLLAVIINIVGFIFYPTASTLLSGEAYTGWETFGTILILLNNLIFIPLLSIWVTASLVRLIDAIMTERRVTLKTVMQEGKGLFGPFLVVSVLFSLVLLATFLFLVPGFLFIFIGNILITSTAVSVIGSLLFIIGIVLAVFFACLWSVRFFFSTYTTLVDKQRGSKALQASSDLVRGRYWEVVVRILLPKILFFVVFAIFLYFARYIADTIITSSTGLNIDLQVRLKTIVFGVLILLQAILINPIVLIADFLIYKDLHDTPSKTL